ncbi:DUF4145 domain-containing protein [Rahnella aquatilis]|uniref:DUF4145 domain-containing protein n=1 Tax=Rahnella aquatilis TaxID=34038 RepID=UPI0036630C0F
MAGPFKFDFFQTDAIPDWSCPVCARATLELVPDSFKEKRTAKAHHEKAMHEGFGPEDDESVFSCLLRCNNKNCLEPVAVSGNGYGERQYHDRSGYDWDYVSIYKPRCFYPALSLFTPCDDYPEKIKAQLIEISAQLPGHPQAAVNALRTTLEIVLDDFKVPRQEKGGYLSLHNRISRIPAPYQYVEAGFRAMKWLGNTGSHNLQPVSPDDIEGACIMLDDYLLRIYQRPADHSATIAQLTQNHNPKFKKQS